MDKTPRLLAWFKMELKVTQMLIAIMEKHPHVYNQDKFHILCAQLGMENTTQIIFYTLGLTLNRDNDRPHTWSLGNTKDGSGVRFSMTLNDEDIYKTIKSYILKIQN